jgi:hypothetical protein
MYTVLHNQVFGRIRHSHKATTLNNLWNYYFNDFTDHIRLWEEGNCPFCGFDPVGIGTSGPERLDSCYGKCHNEMVAVDDFMKSIRLGSP